ncbi:Transcription factor CtBP [Klebsormidium nitens]|uniref:Transcription factor CtBP n=1 Tax=Klebsormidium nitens TaxID=105231 RepID=A0A1Y1IHJ8_KLENI|nr:Transcription factor CtBP [Klebsormidium nitens]|eukprot:GAQ88541.1 Transcription factor CtBP [Klebsormidium nitens]
MGGSLNGSLEDGLMVAFKAKDKGQYWVATERRGWALELGAPGVDASDPAAQFLVVMRGKDRLGFRSLVADGKLLQVRERTSKGHPQATRKLELMFVNFSLDTLENWLITGTSLADCVISSKKFPEVSLALSLEVLAVPPEEEDVLLDDMAGSVQKPEASPDAEEESLV